MWGALSGEKTGLSFTISVGTCQCMHIYRLWTLAAILLHEFYYNFCDDPSDPAPLTSVMIC
jgi:hypothetical protein